MELERKLLLNLIDEAYDKKSWHGTNLRGSIRGLTAREAAWRPGKGRHSVGEIVVHAAYWKYTVRRRLLGEKKGSFVLKGSNWFARPTESDEQAWREDVDLLRREHRAMRESVAVLSARELFSHVHNSTITADFLIRGIAAHDLYHAGQIQLLKRLYRA